MKWSAGRSTGPALSMLAASVFAYVSAHANTVSYTGTDNGSTVSGSTTTIGGLMGPSNIAFTDVLSQNTSSSPVTTTDDWSFSLPASIFGGTVTGDQISLANFAVAGVVDSFALYSGTASGSHTLLVTGTPTGSFSSYVLDDLTHSGNYYLEVTSTLGPSSIGSYTGTLVAAIMPVPAPGTLPLLISGIAGLGLLSRRKFSSV